jgi:hypothetical protein
MNAKELIGKEIEKGTDAWQAVLNVFYDKWQGGKFKTYAQMVEAAKKVDSLYAYAILMGKLNQQVCNGGWMQYFDNGYASKDGDGCFSSKTDIELHQDLQKLHDQFFPECGEEKKAKLRGLLDDFENSIVDEEEDCDWCGGSGYEDEELNETCGSCGGNGIKDTYSNNLMFDGGEEGDDIYYDLGIEELLLEHFAKVIPESLELEKAVS